MINVPMHAHMYLHSFLYIMYVLSFHVAFLVNLVHGDVILGSLQAVVAHANTHTPCLYL